MSRKEAEVFFEVALEATSGLIFFAGECVILPDAINEVFFRTRAAVSVADLPSATGLETIYNWHRCWSQDVTWKDPERVAR